MKFIIPACPGAFIDLKISMYCIYYIDYIYVPEDHRRQGFGTALLEEGFKFLKEQKVKKVTTYFVGDDAINITYEVAKKFNIEVLPDFCVQRRKNQLFRFKTEEEILQSISEFMIIHGYKSMGDIPQKILLKNWGVR